MKVEQILKLARKKGLRIVTAESCTGGLVSAALTEIAGSSDVFDRGFVTYSNLAKQQMLEVPAAVLAEFGAVSEPVALAMAAGAVQKSDADLAVSITGIAGPGGSDHKPEGRVCFAVAQKATATLSRTQEFGALGRTNVRQRATSYALDLILETLQQ